MKIAFFSSKLTLRGSEIALYDYAHYNETILGNKSIIVTRSFNTIKDERDVSDKAYKKFQSRFKVFFVNNTIDIDFIVNSERVDVFYAIKSGNSIDGVFTRIKKCMNAMHLVFESNYCVPPSELDHTRIAAISPLVASRKKDKQFPPVVPHIVSVFDTVDDLRSELNIPPSSTVFGTYSGSDANVGYIQTVIKHVLAKRIDIYFVFMNITPFISHPNVIFLEGTTDACRKRKFINMCNAMLYMREQGETFGLACAEFSVCGKPVILKSTAVDTQHIEFLGETSIRHDDEYQLEKILVNWDEATVTKPVSKYSEFTPENVMKIFNDVFLI